MQSYTIFVLIISLGFINLFFFLGVESTSKWKISQSFYITLVWCWKLEFFTSNLDVMCRSVLVSSFSLCFDIAKIAKGREFIPAFIPNYLEPNWLSSSYSDSSQFVALPHIDGCQLFNAMPFNSLPLSLSYTCYRITFLITLINLQDITYQKNLYDNILLYLPLSPFHHVLLYIEY